MHAYNIFGAHRVISLESSSVWTDDFEYTLCVNQIDFPFIEREQSTESVAPVSICSGFYLLLFFFVLPLLLCFISLWSNPQRNYYAFSTLATDETHSHSQRPCTEHTDTVSKRIKSDLIYSTNWALDFIYCVCVLRFTCGAWQKANSIEIVWCAFDANSIENPLASIVYVQVHIPTLPPRSNRFMLKLIPTRDHRSTNKSLGINRTKSSEFRFDFFSSSCAFDDESAFGFWISLRARVCVCVHVCIQWRRWQFLLVL